MSESITPLGATIRLPKRAAQRRFHDYLGATEAITVTPPRLVRMAAESAAAMAAMRAEEPTIAMFAEHEARMLAVGTRRGPVPVLLVSGELGAGKTTLLNHILHNKLNLRVTCLVNDFASLNVDAELLLARDEARKTVQLSNGCACHSLSGAFEDEMWQLLQETDALERTDYIVIETSGVADPVTLVQSLERRYGKMTRARLDGVVVLVDADVLAQSLGLGVGVGGGDDGDGEPVCEGCADEDDETWVGGMGSGEAVGDEGGAEKAAQQRLRSAAGFAFVRQLLCADIVLLNKADLLEEGAVSVRE